MSIKIIGLDTAMSVFQVHAVDDVGKIVICRKLHRNELLAFFAKQEGCMVAMEACGAAHHWGRALTDHCVVGALSKDQNPVLRECSRLSLSITPSPRSMSRTAYGYCGEAARLSTSSASARCSRVAAIGYFSAKASAAGRSRV
jgi:hypothetical protein